MDKILLCNDNFGKVDITNDGATILKSIGVDNPAAKVLVDISKVYAVFREFERIKKHLKVLFLFSLQISDSR